MLSSMVLYEAKSMDMNQDMEEEINVAMHNEEENKIVNPQITAGIGLEEHILNRSWLPLEVYILDAFLSCFLVLWSTMSTPWREKSIG